MKIIMPITLLINDYTYTCGDVGAVCWDKYERNSYVE